MAMISTRNRTSFATGISLRELWTKFANVVAVARSRKALQSLDKHLLDDIGVSCKQAITESSKPVWDVPANWRK